MIKTREISHGQLGSSGVNQVLRNVVGGGSVSDFLESYEDVWIIVNGPLQTMFFCNKQLQIRNILQSYTKEFDMD